MKKFKRKKNLPPGLLAVRRANREIERFRLAECRGQIT